MSTAAPDWLSDPARAHYDRLAGILAARGDDVALARALLTIAAVALADVEKLSDGPDRPEDASALATARANAGRALRALDLPFMIPTQHKTAFEN
jgi:hypothetical protein